MEQAKGHTQQSEQDLLTRYAPPKVAWQNRCRKIVELAFYVQTIQAKHARRGRLHYFIDFCIGRGRPPIFSTRHPHHKIEEPW